MTRIFGYEIDNTVTEAAGRTTPAIVGGSRADGRCRWCGDPTHGGTHGNLFYCSEPCRSSAWNYNQQKKAEEESEYDEP